ncbi:MAG: hypothetical protein DRP56_04760 [Planctomycetota bacterium]|nr:MAG: hypothetical protein DRP56_04760 [Planctomycetota bacterium]
MKQEKAIVVIGSIIVALMMVLIAGMANAQDNWHTANQTTVGWDAVTALFNGDPVPPNDTVTYKVYLRDYNTGDETLLTTDGNGIAETQYTITFTAEGLYIVGISAVRQPEGETETIESTICWSDMPDCVDAGGGTFGVKFFQVTATPHGLRIIN